MCDVLYGDPKICEKVRTYFMDGALLFLEHCLSYAKDKENEPLTFNIYDCQ